MKDESCQTESFNRASENYSSDDGLRIKPTPRFNFNQTHQLTQEYELAQLEKTRYLKELKEYQNISNLIDEEQLATIERFFTCIDENESKMGNTIQNYMVIIDQEGNANQSYRSISALENDHEHKNISFQKTQNLQTSITKSFNNKPNIDQIKQCLQNIRKLLSLTNQKFENVKEDFFQIEKQLDISFQPSLAGISKQGFENTQISSQIAASQSKKKLKKEYKEKKMLEIAQGTLLMEMKEIIKLDSARKLNEQSNIDQIRSQYENYQKINENIEMNNNYKTESQNIDLHSLNENQFKIQQNVNRRKTECQRSGLNQIYEKLCIQNSGFNSNPVRKDNLPQQIDLDLYQNMQSSYASNVSHQIQGSESSNNNQNQLVKMEIKQNDITQASQKYFTGSQNDNNLAQSEILDSQKLSNLFDFQRHTFQINAMVSQKKQNMEGLSQMFHTLQKQNQDLSQKISQLQLQESSQQYNENFQKNLQQKIDDLNERENILIQRKNEMDILQQQLIEKEEELNKTKQQLRDEGKKLKILMKEVGRQDQLHRREIKKKEIEIQQSQNTNQIHELNKHNNINILAQDFAPKHSQLTENLISKSDYKNFDDQIINSQSQKQILKPPKAPQYQINCSSHQNLYCFNNMSEQKEMRISNLCSSEIKTNMKAYYRKCQDNQCVKNHNKQQKSEKILEYNDHIFQSSNSQNNILKTIGNLSAKFCNTEAKDSCNSERGNQDSNTKKNITQPIEINKFLINNHFTFESDKNRLDIENLKNFNIIQGHGILSQQMNSESYQVEQIDQNKNSEINSPISSNKKFRQNNIDLTEKKNIQSAKVNKQLQPNEQNSRIIEKLKEKGQFKHIK